jgi:hypothetical protein
MPKHRPTATADINCIARKQAQSQLGRYNMETRAGIAGTMSYKAASGCFTTNCELLVPCWLHREGVTPPTLLVLDLLLHILDGVGGLHLEGDSLTREGLHENLRAARMGGETVMVVTGRHKNLQNW